MKSQPAPPDHHHRGRMGERVNWSEEHLDARINASFYSGISSGIERVVNWMKHKSGEAYAHGSDQLAKMLRDTADEIKKDVLNGAKKQANECAERLTEVEAEDAEPRPTSKRSGRTRGT